MDQSKGRGIPFPPADRAYLLYLCVPPFLLRVCVLCWESVGVGVPRLFAASRSGWQRSRETGRKGRGSQTLRTHQPRTGSTTGAHTHAHSLLPSLPRPLRPSRLCVLSAPLVSPTCGFPLPVSLGRAAREGRTDLWRKGPPPRRRTPQRQRAQTTHKETHFGRLCAPLALPVSLSLSALCPARSGALARCTQRKEDGGHRCARSAQSDADERSSQPRAIGCAILYCVRYLRPPRCCPSPLPSRSSARVAFAPLPLPLSPTPHPHFV